MVKSHMQQVTKALFGGEMAPLYYSGLICGMIILCKSSIPGFSLLLSTKRSQKLNSCWTTIWSHSFSFLYLNKPFRSIKISKITFKQYKCIIAQKTLGALFGGVTSTHPLNSTTSHTETPSHQLLLFGFGILSAPINSESSPGYFLWTR